MNGEIEVPETISELTRLVKRYRRAYFAAEDDTRMTSGGVAAMRDYLALIDGGDWNNPDAVNEWAKDRETIEAIAAKYAKRMHDGMREELRRKMAELLEEDL